MNISKWIEDIITSDKSLSMPIMTHPGIELLGKKPIVSLTETLSILVRNYWFQPLELLVPSIETDSSNGCSSNCTMILFYFDRHPFILEGCFLILYFPVSFLFL